MNAKTFLLLAGFFMSAGPASALTVYTVSNNDWSSPYAWNTGQVPAGADTIIIKHYITFSQNLTIPAPTVLFVEAGGTLCGDFELNVSCGARFLNYGHVYVNTAKIRDGKNYNAFFAKNQMSIMGCNQAGYGTGYYNLAPNGTTQVWPPVLCKTSGTNWENGGTPTSLKYFTEARQLRIYPNPVHNQLLFISASQVLNAELHDLTGRSIWSGQGSNAYTINLDLVPAGIYFLTVSDGQSQLTQKIINMQ